MIYIRSIMVYSRSILVLLRPIMFHFRLLFVNFRSILINFRSILVVFRSLHPHFELKEAGTISSGFVDFPARLMVNFPGDINVFGKKVYKLHTNFSKHDVDA